LQPVPASFGKTNYRGVTAFGLVDASGNKHFGKWIFEPAGGTQTLTDDEAKAKGTDFLFDDLRQRVKSDSVAFDFNFQLAEAGDKIDSAVVPLPEGRKKVTLGRLTIKSVSPDSTGSCVAITFLPTVLPKGVEPSNDPMIAARVAPYAVSLGRRLTEGAKQ
jgi:catalase